MRDLKVKCRIGRGDAVELTTEEGDVVVYAAGSVGILVTPAKARRMAAWLIEAADLLDGTEEDDTGAEVI